MDALNRRRSARHERGTSMVEMVFVMPVLLLLLFGLADFSLVFHDYLAAMNAARAGVRAATLTKLNCQSTTLEQEGHDRAKELLDRNAVKEVTSITFTHAAPSQKGLCMPGYVTLDIHVKSRHRLLEGFFGDPTFFPRIEFTASAGAMSENGF
ncbi:MAG TPA: TadE/TadG family type IV pilus assembly protein [Myxococcota bacterium]|nr:TadE/TadG family type IV pilus assembly protein [Myxococcota bacterium]